MNRSRVLLLTLLAMLAFAANSLLCRVALRDTRIDAASFTLARLASGALILWLVALVRRLDWRTFGNWPSAFALFVYAAAFSFAYVSLSAGTGALLLFGAVQATMIFCGWRKGEALHGRQIVGLTLAVAGLSVLVFPGLSAPPLLGSVLMLGAGAAWGIYSLRGKAAGDPASATTGNFIRALPFAAALSLAFLPSIQLDRMGLELALLSGGLASGIGYIIWYGALPYLKAASAASVQLSVPVIAGAGGMLLLGEPLTLRYLLASIAVLGGIALVLLPRADTCRIVQPRIA